MRELLIYAAGMLLLAVGTGAAAWLVNRPARYRRGR